MITDKNKDKYIEIRTTELTADSEEFKNRYIAHLELFLNDTLAYFEKEETNSDDEDKFNSEYFGLLTDDALNLIKKLEKR